MNETLLTAAGVAGAVAASSCCIIRLALTALGVSAAWIGALTSLSPYQPLFIAFAVSCLGAGFCLVYRGDSAACAIDSGRNLRWRRFLGDVVWVKAALWAGTALIAASVGIDYPPSCRCSRSRRFSSLASCNSLTSAAAVVTWVM